MKTRRTWLCFVGVSIGVAGLLLVADLLHQGMNSWIDIALFDSVNNLLLGEFIAIVAVIVFLFVTKERRWLLGAWLISGIATLLILNIILNNYYWYPQNYAGASVEYGCYLGELYTTNVQQRGTCIIRNIPNVLSETDAYNPAVGAFVILQLPLLSTPLGFELLKRVRRLNSQT